MSFSAILFDLDGTISDPREGITRSIRHALEKMAQPSPPLADLTRYIGPPLRGTFAQLLNSDDPAVAAEAIRFFRERFSTVGLFENVPYPGIEQLLRTLHRQGRALFIATGKPRPFAQRILVHFELDGYFQGVYGSELDGRFEQKTDLLGHLFQNEKLEPARTVMIGDRAQDIDAARSQGITAIGVTYGFGSAAELQRAGADHLCHSLDELGRLLAE